ncbi:efflux RND transporter periplasmic adaptor subunit [Massilia glaciei]|uniref:Efflux RND transporter periplasmic adaptor subunit n=2 Tax=Massilia glaciei TaxID=1524097 RepID=A0A2U2HFK3_9BURK|nr:efflux RND transporter periplasmic adaptor subunit [Massilia glaciei]
MNKLTQGRKSASALASLLIVAGALLIGGCDRHGEAGHAEATAKEEGAQLEPVTFTHFSDRTELFVEFPPLTVGHESPFAAHLSTLSDFRPVMAGKVTVTLSGGKQPTETFTVDRVANPGIFRPVAKPKYPGPRKLVFRLDTAQGSSVHDLGEVTVFADQAGALRAQAAEKPEPPGAIAYLKEQQWKTEYALSEVGKRSLRESVAATGTLRAPANQDAQLTAVSAGQVVAAGQFPQIGMVVKKGQLLAYLVPRLGGDTDIATLDLAMQKARLGVQQAARERERLEALHKQEAVPERRVIAARNEESLARAELTGAQRRAGQYRNDGGSGGGIAIRAPISGTVAEVGVAPGGFINEGQPIVHIVNADRLWLEVRVAESDIGRLGEPTGAAFRVDGFDTSFEIDERHGGRIVGFGGVIDPVSRTAPLVFEFPNPQRRLRIGMAARTSVFAGKRIESLAIPAAAVVDDNGVPVVYVLRHGEAFERRQVRLGVRDGDWVAVKSGVAAGERVVSKGAYQVRLAATTPAAMGEGHAH